MTSIIPHKFLSTFALTLTRVVQRMPLCLQTVDHFNFCESQTQDTRFKIRHTKYYIISTTNLTVKIHYTYLHKYNVHL